MPLQSLFIRGWKQLSAYNSMQFLPLYNSKTITLPIGVQSICYVSIR